MQSKIFLPALPEFIQRRETTKRDDRQSIYKIKLLIYDCTPALRRTEYLDYLTNSVNIQFTRMRMDDLHSMEIPVTDVITFIFVVIAPRVCLHVRFSLTIDVILILDTLFRFSVSLELHKQTHHEVIFRLFCYLSPSASFVSEL